VRLRKVLKRVDEGGSSQATSPQTAVTTRLIRYFVWCLSPRIGDYTASPRLLRGAVDVCLETLVLEPPTRMRLVARRPALWVYPNILIAWIIGGDFLYPIEAALIWQASCLPSTSRDD